MKLLKVSFDNVRMFKEGLFEIDFFAADRVFLDEESVWKIKDSLYTNNVIALGGINASGKTVSLLLLQLAIEILNGSPIEEASARKKEISSIFQGSSQMKVMFFFEGSFYILSSMLQEKESDDLDVSCKKELVFVDETIYKIPSSIVNKTLLKEKIDSIINRGVVFISRSEILGKKLAFLADNQSIIPLLGENKHPGLGLYESDYPFVNAANTSDALATLLRAFDPSIEDIEVFDKGRAYRLSFTNSEEPIITNEEGLVEILSSGTLKGLITVQFALAILRVGGYLLLDEIENHLNHQLVKLILDLFVRQDTNPHGATLVFTTHYAEVLDHIHRKDCIYFLPRIAKNETEIVKYSSRVKRIENKKSEVFTSNYIKGTAPSFREMNALKEYVKQNV